MKVLLTAIAIAFLSTTAFAETESGFYAGLGVGQFNVEIDDPGDVGSTVESFDSDDTSFKVFAGWRFFPFLAAEVAYIDLGKPEDEINGTKIEADVNGIAPYLIGTLPLGPVELFAKVGYYFYDFELKAEDLEDRLDESDEDFVYGAGIGITLFDHLNTQIEYEIIDASNVDDANALWLTGAWRF